jgi:histidinol dehydrogenase
MSEIQEVVTETANVSEKEVSAEKEIPSEQEERSKRGIISLTDLRRKSVNELYDLAQDYQIENPFALLPLIKHAGAIFMGSYTPEPIGDYIAGPNHTLPTGGTARFYSPLNVENFLKKSSIIAMSKQGIDALGSACALLAKTEGLDAHQKSVEIRLKD